MTGLLAVCFLAVSALAVVAFVVASARNIDAYEESLRPPEDLRRAGDGETPNGGSPSGGNIWPS